MSFFDGERPSKSSSSPTKKTIIIAIVKKRIFTKLEYKIKEIIIDTKNATPPKIGTLPLCADLLPATSDNLYLDAKEINFGIIK
tara:strand:+ start:8510 stop:8761 length:252 start_codon:yes stop_codon:yes gene_type:complete